MDHEADDDDDAARAFEALREEVAALRRGVELVYRQGQQAVPDYSPTLGQMEQALQAIAGRLSRPCTRCRARRAIWRRWPGECASGGSSWCGC
jgi:hypothetical protein